MDSKRFELWKLFEPFHKEYLKSGCKYFAEYVERLDLGIKLHREYANGEPSLLKESYSIIDPKKYMLAKIKYGF
jgi:hypothetical protein